MVDGDEAGDAALDDLLPDHVGGVEAGLRAGVDRVLDLDGERGVRRDGAALQPGQRPRTGGGGGGGGGGAGVDGLGVGVVAAAGSRRRRAGNQAAQHSPASRTAPRWRRGGVRCHGVLLRRECCDRPRGARVTGGRSSVVIGCRRSSQHRRRPVRPSRDAGIRWFLSVGARTVQPARPTPTWRTSVTLPATARLGLDYLEEVSAKLMLQAQWSGAMPFLRAGSVPGTVEDLAALLPEGARLRFDQRWQRHRTVTAELPGLVVELETRQNVTRLVVVGAVLTAVESCLAGMTSAAEAAAAVPEGIVRMRFWSSRDDDASMSSRAVAAPTWREVSANYAARTAAGLAPLVAATDMAGRAGRLVLWHGEPGTGKTTAVRALSREWSAWCEPHYVTDPEQLFADPQYLLEVAGVDAEEDDGAAEKRPWRLVIAEDCDEYLRTDAKLRRGLAGPAAQPLRRDPGPRAAGAGAADHERGRQEPAPGDHPAGALPEPGGVRPAVACRGAGVARARAHRSGRAGHPGRAVRAPGGPRGPHRPRPGGGRLPLIQRGPHRETSCTIRRAAARPSGAGTSG